MTHLWVGGDGERWMKERVRKRRENRAAVRKIKHGEKKIDKKRERRKKEQREWRIECT